VSTNCVTAKTMGSAFAKNKNAGDEAGGTKSATADSPGSAAASSPAEEPLAAGGGATSSGSGSGSGSSSPDALSPSSRSPRLGSRRPSMKVSLTDEELAESVASFTMSNPLPEAATAVTITLQPHEHSLFCERKERVCTSSGKLQEHETLLVQFTGDAASRVHVPSVSWQRSGPSASPPPGTGSDGGTAHTEAEALAALQFSAIAGSEGSTTYELTAEDVGCYLKVAGTYKPASWVALATGEIAPEGLGEESLWQGEAFESSHVLGPVVPGPPRLLLIRIGGEARVGQSLRAELDYVGGIPGQSEFWWMRIRDGQRENLSDPVALTAAQTLLFDPDDDTDPRRYPPSGACPACPACLVQSTHSPAPPFPPGTCWARPISAVSLSSSVAPFAPTATAGRCSPANPRTPSRPLRHW
jgi:hypothetical protein